MWDDDMCLNLGISAQPPAPHASSFQRTDQELPGYPVASGPLLGPPVIFSASPGLGYWASRKWFDNTSSPLGW